MVAEKNVVREDIVQIGFELEGFAETQAQVDGLLGGIGGQSDQITGDIRQMGEAARGAVADVGNIAEQAQQISADGIREVAAGVSDIATQAQQVSSDNIQEAAESVGEIAEQARQVSADGIREAAQASERVAGSGEHAAEGIREISESAQQTVKPFSQLVREAKSFIKLKFTQTIQSLKKVKNSAVDRVFSSVTKLKRGFAGLKNVRLGDITKSMRKGLGSAVTGAGNLLKSLKGIAGTGLEKLKASLASLGKNAGQISAKIAKGIGSATLKGAKRLTAGILAAGAAAGGLAGAGINAGMNFEAGMSQVAATMGITKDAAEFEQLSKAAKEAGKSTQFSATQASEALNYLALAGYDANKATAALPSVLSLAAAGGMELAAASDMVTDSMSALGIEATQDNLNRFSDQLAKTAQKSNTSVAQLGEAVLTVGGTAKTLSGGTTEMNTLLGIIADNGVKGAEGGTALRNVMLSLQAPTDVAAKKMKSLGLQVYTAEGKMRPMNDILNDLNGSMDTMTDQQKQDVLSTIFNKRDLKSVNALLANSGARFDELSGYVENSEGACADMAKTMNDNLKGTLVTMGSAAEGLGIAFYEGVDNPMKDIVQEATGWIGELTDAMESGGVDGLVNAAGDVLSKVALKIAEGAPKLVKAGVNIIHSLVDGMKRNAPQIAAGAASTISTLISGIVTLLPEILLLGIDLIVELAKGMVNQLPQIIKSGAAALESFAQGLANRIPDLIHTAVQLILSLAKGIIQNLPTIIKAGVQIVMSLSAGLIQAVPELIGASGELVMALIDVLIHTNWLEVGMDIVKGIGKGMMDSAKSLFGGGKEAAKEMVDGASAGYVSNAPLLSNSVDKTFQSATTGLQPYSQDMFAVGAETSQALADGISSSSPMVLGTLKDTSGMLLETTDSGMASGARAMGLNVSQNLAGGITSGSAQVQTAAKSVAAQATDSVAAIRPTVGIEVAAKPAELSGLKKATKSVTQQLQKDSVALTQTIHTMQITADQGAQSIRKSFESVNLNGTGKNILNGLIRGMESRKSAVIKTAKTIAQSIKTAMNGALDIHSPSRVLEKTGEYSGEGLTKGLESSQREVKAVAEDTGGIVADIPVRSKPAVAPAISPYTAAAANSYSQNKTENNTYAPVFNLTINGGDSDRDQERKVKRWVSEAMNDVFDSMGRKNPRLQEV